jgi:hypothetical protein
MGRNRNMPTRKKIFEYWQDKINTALDDNTCFKCGFTGGFTAVERTHIISVFNDGTDDLENLHLLCSNCHKKSEPYEGKLYFDWFYSKDDLNFIYTACYNFLKNKKDYPKGFELFVEEIQNKMGYNKKEFKTVLKNIKYINDNWLS